MTAIENLLSSIKKGLPSGNEEIMQLEKTIDFTIDPNLMSFIKQYNGGSGRLGDNAYILFWSINDMIKLNPYYSAEVDGGFSSGIFFFGSNGGDAGFGIKKSNGKFVEIPYLDMEEDGIIYLGDNFKEFIINLANR